MQYRTDKATGNKLSALGLGCMRFPRDKAETERMILAAIDGGVNFFDTAYIYPNSENTLGEILAKHNRRKDIYLATKLPLMFCKKYEDFDRYFSEQLRRLKTDYIDYYFMHSMSDFKQWEFLKNLGIEKWITEKKSSGQIRHIGFSYHGIHENFIKILHDYPWEFCMIQYNYYDENYQAGKKGLQAAAEKGVSVLIMEPLLGGRLATGLPKRAVDLFNKADRMAGSNRASLGSAAQSTETLLAQTLNRTPADWAFWWLWNQPEVTVVLSGMTSAIQMQSNMASADKFRPLSADELSTYTDVVKIFRESYKINCTGCNYCLPCPKGINIPALFSAYNTRYAQGYVAGATMYYTSVAAMKQNPTSPHICNDCGKCEKICPQFIPIRSMLKKVGRRFEPLPVQLVLKAVRKMIAAKK